MAATEKDTLQSALDSANTSLSSHDSYVSSRGERQLNRAEDMYEAINGNPYVLATSNLTSAGIDLLQTELDNFKSSSEILMQTLDAIAQIHPFVSVAVIAFKTAVMFEITRRSNDKRILALHVQMKDTMSIVVLLRNLAKSDRGKDGQCIEDRLRNRMTAIAHDIKACSESCDTMQKKKLVAKIFKSIAWEAKLKSFAAAFIDHKDTLKENLAMHASLTIEKTAEQLNVVLLFRQLQSPIERDLWKFIETHGGPERFLQDDQLMNQLRARCPVQQAASEIGVSKAELFVELKATTSELIREHGEVFTRKFNAQQAAVREAMNQDITRVGDRIIQALTIGASCERLVDPDVYELWKDMGWKGNVKAKYFVMNLREYFAERYDLQLYEWNGIATTLGVTEGGQQTTSNPCALSLQDRRGFSAFITVREINTFTKSRPVGWSLTKWMAFWAKGFALSLHHHYDRIRSILAGIDVASQRTLSSNRALVDRFMGSLPMRHVDAVLAGVRSCKEDESMDTELFSRFSDYVKHEESITKKILDELRFYLDAPETVTMVLGPGRPEKRLLLLLYLLLEKALQIIRASEKFPLQRTELLAIQESMSSVQGATIARLTTLKAMFRLENAEVKQELKRFSFGMYYFVEHPDEVLESDYYKYDYYTLPRDMPTYDSTIINALDLYNGVYSDDLDASAYDYNSMPSGLKSGDLILQSPLSVPLWRGSYQSGDMTIGFGLLDLELPPGLLGTFHGTGSDITGDFTVYGKCSETRICFVKEYAVKENWTSKWRYEGDLGESSQEISGAYAHADVLELDFDKTLISEANSLGHFNISRRCAYYFRSRDAIPLVENRASYLWRTAIHSVVHAVRARARYVPWSLFSERRDNRRRFLELYMKLDEEAGTWGVLSSRESLSAGEYKDLSDLENSLPLADLRYYRSLVTYLMRREVVHFECCCNACGKDALHTTRLICLDCALSMSSGNMDTVDVCSDCINATFARPFDGEYHLPAHALLQIRSSVPNRRIYDLIGRAIAILQETRSADVETFVPTHECLRCKFGSQSTSWLCIDCDDTSLICDVCNQKDEENRLSLHNLEGNQQPYTITGNANEVQKAKKHHWIHSLIRLLPAQSQPDVSSSADNCINNIDNQLYVLGNTPQGVNPELVTRLQAIEASIGHLLMMLTAENSYLQ